MPINRGCEPVNYVFTAEPICSNGVPIEGNAEFLVAAVTVYPEYNTDFVAIEVGTCSQVGYLATICNNYTLVAPESRSLPGPNQSGYDEWSVVYNDDNPAACFQEVFVQVPYSCGLTCPQLPMLRTNKTVICSGEAVTLNAFFADDSEDLLDGTLSIMETTSTVTDIVNGEPFQLPANNACEPVVYTFILEATCQDQTPIVGSPDEIVVRVTVFPDFNDDFLAIIPGTCEAFPQIQSFCNRYEVVPPENRSFPVDGENIQEEWTINYLDNDIENSCFEAQTLSVAFNCAEDCPGAPTLRATESVVCSGGEAMLQISFDRDTTGLNPVTINITESSNQLNDLKVNEAFRLPINNSCEPVQYTFIATATCNGSILAGTGNQLTATITVYPAFNENLVLVQNGACGVAPDLISLCPNYNLIPPTNPTIPEAGMIGADAWTINYMGTDDALCFSDRVVEVPYRCDEGCPAFPILDINKTDVCNGDTIRFSASFQFGQVDETISFSLEETNGLLSDLSLEEAIVLPDNNACEPKVYSFLLKAFCDGEEILPQNALDLLKTVTVYPAFNEDLLVIESGDCNQAGQVISQCGRYDLTPPENPTIPTNGLIGVDKWIVTYTGERDQVFSCFEPQTVDVFFSCGVSCPNNPTITAQSTSTCSGGMGLIETDFASNASDLTLNFRITELSGTIEGIVAGEAFELPANLGCEPIQYFFTATAICENGEVIPGRTGEALSTSITVYPEPTFYQMESCSFFLVTDCSPEDFSYQIAYDDFSGDFSTEPILFPFDNDSILWKISMDFDNDGMEDCSITGDEPLYSTDCPNVDNGCPYPTITAKTGTLDSNNPMSAASNNGPVALICRLPAVLGSNRLIMEQVESGELTISYQWGYYKDGVFTIPPDGNTQMPFYVVNPADSVQHLSSYGVIVTTDNCTNNSIITYRGKVEEEQEIGIATALVRLYPNPNNGQFFLQMIHPNLSGDIELNLYNSIGQLIQQKKVVKSDETLLVPINIQQPSTGLYLLQIKVNGAEWRWEKVVIGDK